MKEVTVVGQYNPFSTNVGGIEVYITNLINELNKHNYNVTILGWSSIKKKSKNFKPIVVSKKILGRKFSLNLFLKTPFMSLSQGPILVDRPDRVIPFFFRKNKLICFLHGSHLKNVYTKKGKILGMFYHILEYIAFKRADTIIAVSEDDKKNYVKQYPFINKKISVIPVGVNSNFKPMEQKKLRKKYGFSVNDKIVLYVGRLEKEKQVDQIIKSFSRINAKLIIVGEGREESKLRDLVKQLNLKNIIFIKGLEHKKIPEIMNCADALVLFSTHEGMPTVVLEALACGKPVVSSDVGDVRKVVIHNKTGFIANKENFANYVRKVLQNPSKFKKACVEMASNYSWNKIGEKVTDIL